ALIGLTSFLFYAPNSTALAFTSSIPNGEKRPDEDKNFDSPGLADLADTAIGWITEFPGDLSIILKAEATIGGDNLLDTNSEFGELEELNAGDFAGVAAGVQWIAEDWPLMIRATVGYKFQWIDENAGKFGFARVPWEVVGYVGTTHHKVGLGASYQDDPLLRIRSTNLNLPLEDKEYYHDATGCIVEYIFLASERIAVNARYVFIEYDPENNNLKDVTGDHFGIGISYSYF
ncbi:MAG TPA: hypothetical protein DCZ03_15670, partial [Gammaproteobacteria bacterium]|nr:hypothetical protein [Gammaproteobacteria bacterium]